MVKSEAAFDGRSTLHRGLYLTAIALRSRSTEHLSFDIAGEKRRKIFSCDFPDATLSSVLHKLVGRTSSTNWQDRLGSIRARFGMLRAMLISLLKSLIARGLSHTSGEWDQFVVGLFKCGRRRRCVAIKRLFRRFTASRGACKPV